MSKTKLLVVLVGAAMGFGSAALAQSSTQDAARAYEAELNADAAARTSAAAGPKFKIEDGSNYLNVGGLIQFRYVADFRDEDTVGKFDDLTHGFQLRRTRLNVDGSFFDPALTFRIEGEFARSGGDFTLFDAYGNWDYGNGASIRFGQFKAPLLREELVSDRKQLASERSLVNSGFSAMRSQGIMISYQGEEFRLHGSFNDGWRAANTDFNGTEADYAVTGRFEYKFAGDWNRFEDFTSWQGSDLAVMAGAAIHYQSSGDTGDGADGVPPPGSDPGTRLVIYTADVSIEGDGWNAFAAFIGSNNDPQASGISTTDHFGVVAQGGIFVAPQWEFFGRYDGLFADDQLTVPALDPDSFHWVTVGVNFYVTPESHAFKLSADIFYAFEETGALRGANIFPLVPNSGSFAPNTGGTSLGDTEAGEVGVRVGAQLSF